MRIEKQAILALTTAVALGVTPAFAGNGNGNGNGNGAGHGNSGNNGQGSIRSELKGANASNANPNALEHAAPNSRVGKSATYRDAAAATAELEASQSEAQKALDDYVEGGGQLASTDIQNAIDALDPESDSYADDLAALEAELTKAVTYEEGVAMHQDELDQIAADIEAAKAEEHDALLALTDGRELSDAALAELRDNLDLETMQ